jgi:hypothetical protein
MGILKRLLIASALAAAAFGVTTWWALESGGVAVVGTRTPEGDVRSTHVWYAEPDGELWLEAGTPENPWFRDIQVSPELDFTSEGRSRRYTAHPIEGSSGHRRIRALLLEKYGFRDRWVGLLVDTSGSVAVRLEPIEGRE